jgi:phenylalanyl-tRNA synthetase alpha chain
MIPFTDGQKKRLWELGAAPSVCGGEFESAAQRDGQFKILEKDLVNALKARLLVLREQTRRPALLILQRDIENALCEEGFVQVSTPLIMAKKQLERMSVGDGHPLVSQVFWLDDGLKCLRPMLAPNLYSVSIDLLRVWEKPIRVFEIGSCFRKESQGNRHLNEFTMCNLVEWGMREDERTERLRQLAHIVMEAAGIDDYDIQETDSEVYGASLDVMRGDTELASGNVGPHFLDANWGIRSTWVGLGFGLERLLMTKRRTNNIHSVGKSLSYLDGARLKIN